MPRIPLLSARKIVHILGREDFIIMRQRGSHIVMQKKLINSTRTVVIPDYREVPKGTLRSIIRKAGLTVEEFVRFLEE